tara:strand:+ start:126 stop:308 length:183 start_codon:yes stop_codon:yes gene_type:complete
MFNTEKPKKTKEQLCPVNKIMFKINEDHKDKSRLKLDEKDIFEGMVQKPEKPKKKKKKKK